jgi:acetyl-CoA carboxylase biotin carboxyl carrier protein
MAILGFDLDEIAKLLALVDQHGLEEILLEEGEQSLRIRGANYTRKTSKSGAVTVVETKAPPPPRLSPSAPQSSLPKPPSTHSEGATEGTVALKAPMVGVFYRSSQPGTPPLIEIGQAITVGQPIGIIEAMKIFSEIPAEQGGVVHAILVPDGKLVQAGETIVLLKSG